MELVVLSGKGGTGKTTIVAALSELSKAPIKVDCDVDAPNLYLFYKGMDLEKKYFYGGKKAHIDPNKCVGCGLCKTVCKFDAISNHTIDSFSCEGCAACTLVCPQSAIKLLEEKTADTYITKTDASIISRARMEIGSDGSGKLITYLRKNSKRFSDNNTLTLLDGSPGIGCSVIASMTGTNAMLVVTEPTQSGLEDLKRILKLAEHFEIFTMVAINKYDINETISNEIEQYLKQRSIYVVGKIPFDSKVMESVNGLKPITSYANSIARKEIEAMWLRINSLLKGLE